MSNSRTVRASRDGDQFHYLWAARRCLRLLSPSDNLVAITIEGASPAEGSSPEEQIEEGEEIIDVAEYYGDQSFANASRIRYIQLKHSTLRTNQQWQPSELADTFRKFAERYLKLEEILGTDTAVSKLEFWFVSNRQVGLDFHETIADAASGAQPRHSENLKKLGTFTNLAGPALSTFCKLFQFDDNQDGYWAQRNLLSQDVRGYLADADLDAPAQLKELVTRKASSEGAKNPAITKMDVLLALKTEERYLFPAPCLIERIPNVVPREQEQDLIGKIINAGSQPVVLHAAAGVGKSIFSTRISSGLPDGSVAILYDCFGDGRYRTASSYRHRHEDALVQIANELAEKGLCHPLIPTSRARASDYAKAFVYRLEQSISSLVASKKDGLLCLIIDAADNAQMAAEEVGEARSFVLDLIRERIPEGVRLVFTCRTHRQELLRPPPAALRLELAPFSRSETAQYLRQTFPDAREQDVDEFYSLSSRNPRVQALALSRKLSLQAILLELGPDPTTVDATIEKLLEAAVDGVRDEISSVEREQLDAVCAGLAVLRPLIPIPVLASLSGVNAAAIRSFALDLGRALVLAGDSIQFRDEPSETWFREHFKPRSTDFGLFIEKLMPIATTSAYVAAVLPQLMLEADRFSELVTLALSSEALPSNNPVERRDVELQRLQFALKASLRIKRYRDAASLSLKAGGESAGNERQERLLQGNTDLAAIFLENDVIRDIAARAVFGSGWFGSHNAYEAGLMSSKPELTGEASSRLRMAEDWLRSWSLRSEEEREREPVTNNDIAEMAVARFNIHGARACAKFLRSWRPHDISFHAGKLLARRFVDNGRYEDLDVLAITAGNDLGLVLAITLELREIHRNPPKDVVLRALRLLRNRRVAVDLGRRRQAQEDTVEAVTSIVAAGYKLETHTGGELAAVLAEYLPVSPPRSLSARYGGLRFQLLRAYSFRAALVHQTLELTDLAYDELKGELQRTQPGTYGSYRSRELLEFEQNVGTLLPWHRLWARALTGALSTANFSKAVEDARSASSMASHSTYGDDGGTLDEIAIAWLDAVLEVNDDQSSQLEAFAQWTTSQRRPLFIPTSTRIARKCARKRSLATQALNFASVVAAALGGDRDDAETAAAAYISLARSILSVSPADARAYFNLAVTVASKFGDEVLDRWSAILHLAERAGGRQTPAADLAYRVGRAAELTHRYVRDKHFDWEATVKTISGLCASSSIAIISRWRDRNFGWVEQLVPITVKSLIERRGLDPRTAVAVTCFRAQWDKPRLLRAALPNFANRVEKESAAQFIYR